MAKRHNPIQMIFESMSVDYELPPASAGGLKNPKPLWAFAQSPFEFLKAIFGHKMIILLMKCFFLMMFFLIFDVIPNFIH